MQGILQLMSCVGGVRVGVASAEDQQFQNKTALFCGKNKKKTKATGAMYQFKVMLLHDIRVLYYYL